MKIHWTKLTHRFLDERQCLASFIACQAAEVIANVKPANLISVLNRELPCGRNMYTLWKKHKFSTLAKGHTLAIDFKRNDDRQLVLVYNPVALNNVLQRKPVKKVLGRLGYEYKTLNEALGHLKTRMKGNDFPHEIGFFLGYPVKDVFAFMGLCDLPLVGNGPWRMYGKLESSLAVLNEHNAAREAMLDALQSGINPLSLLQKKRPEFQQAA